MALNMMRGTCKPAAPIGGLDYGDIHVAQGFHSALPRFTPA